MIRRHRLKKKMSRKEVAKKLRIKLHEYDRYEKRRERMSLKRAYALSNLLKIPISLI